MTSALEKLKALERLASQAPWHRGAGDVGNNEGDVAISTMNYDNYEADAQLICAARNLLPSFLEFVEAMRDVPDIADGIPGYFKKLEAAIAKEMG